MGSPPGKSPGISADGAGGEPRPLQGAADLGDKTRPFQRGNAPHVFPEFDPQIFPGGIAQAGYELVSAVYVPRGQVGYLKGCRVAPWLGQFLGDPQVPGGAVIPQIPLTDVFDLPTWLSYNMGADGATTMLWEWQLRVIRGRPEKLRSVRNFGNDPFYMLEGVPAPADTYELASGAAQVPGSPVGGFWPWDPMPRFGEHVGSFSLNVQVPPDHTLCLWSHWTQTIIIDPDSGPEPIPLFFILGPTIGELTGFYGPADRAAMKRLAREGWGG